MATPPRLYGSADGSPTGTFHITSRCCDNSVKLGTAAIKDRFAAIMRAYEKFSEVQVLGYVLMANHFQIIVRVPKLPENFSLNDEEWCKKMRIVQGKRHWAKTLARLTSLRSEGDHEGAEEFKARAYRRMGNMWEFVKGVKEAFTKWYNHTQDHRGTIWENRFESHVIREDVPRLRTLSILLDMNPVRAGLTEDPADYAWCNLGAAMAGDTRALDAIASLMDLRAGTAPPGQSPSGAQRIKALAMYRALIKSSVSRPRS